MKKQLMIALLSIAPALGIVAQDKLYKDEFPLEIKLMGEEFPSDVPCDLKITGNAVDCDEQKNLVVKAYNMIAADFKIPRIHAHLVKRIPSQAGMGGGSSDAAYMIRLLDERFRLNIGNSEMERYAAKLGADCAFFISADPEDGDTACYAEGIGDVLMPVSGPGDNMKGYYIVVVKRDDIAVSTKDAYAAITPKQPDKCCRDIARQPIETWKEELINDFEAPIFAMHPELAAIKESLYNLGAVYAAMSGSGSAIFGIFKHKPANIEEQFDGMFCKVLKL